MPLRTIVESEEFDGSRSKIAATVARIDSSLSGLTWMLARGAEDFPHIDGENSPRIATVGPFGWESGNWTTYYVLFRILDEHSVELLWIAEEPSISIH